MCDFEFGHIEPSLGKGRRISGIASLVSWRRLNFEGWHGRTRGKGVEFDPASEKPR